MLCIQYDVFAVFSYYFAVFDVEDLAFVDTEDPESNKTLMAIYDMMRERGATEIDIPGDIGDYGENNLYDIDGLKVLLTNVMGGYYTATICGQ